MLATHPGLFRAQCCECVLACSSPEHETKLLRELFPKWGIKYNWLFWQNTIAKLLQETKWLLQIRNKSVDSCDHLSEDIQDIQVHFIKINILQI